MKTALLPTAKHQDLIYDVGMHRGEDTEFYLLKGFRCVAFEADPESADFCRQKFAGYISSGQLKIVEGAIVDERALAAGQKTVKFFKNENLAVLGTLSDQWAEQNEKLGSASKVIHVGVVNFEEVLREHGIPHYLKIDIEGNDLICVAALRKFQVRPDYISIEADRSRFANNQREIALFQELGYNRFQLVEQSEGPLSQTPPCPAREGKYVAHRFEKNCSGLFGAELNDPWMSADEVLGFCRAIRLGHYLIGNSGVMTHWKFKGSKRLRWWTQRLIRRFTKTAVPGWHDIHARLQ